MLRGSLTSKQVCHGIHHVSATLCFLKKIKQVPEDVILSVCACIKYVPTYQFFVPDERRHNLVMECLTGNSWQVPSILFT